MAVVRVRGLNRVRKKTADGREVIYWYAWKGGPRLEGKPGSPEFLASYNAAVAARRTPRNDTLTGLVAAYRASPEFTTKSESTKKEWGRWLDRIAADASDKDIGGLPVKLLDDRRVREVLLDWRDQWAHMPRTADYAMQVLHRVLSWAHGRGKLAINAAAGIGQLWESKRADQIWTADDVKAFVDKAKSPEVGFIIRLACLTGLRREDLTNLAWSHVGDLAIAKPTGKSGGRKIATIPLLDETKSLLDEIKAQQARRHGELCHRAKKKGRPPPPAPLTVLSSTRCTPWSVNGLEHQVIDTKKLAEIDKHLHDARGTFGTRLRKAGLTGPEIADVLGWEEDRVERLLAAYVDRNAIIKALSERIRRNEAGAPAPNNLPTDPEISYSEGRK